jgi:hypothetical protein
MNDFRDFAHRSAPDRKVGTGWALALSRADGMVQQVFQTYFSNPKWETDLHTASPDSLQACLTAAEIMREEAKDDYVILELAVTVEYVTKRRLMGIAMAEPIAISTDVKESRHQDALDALTQTTEALRSAAPTAPDDVVEWPDVAGLLQELYNARRSLNGEAYEAVQAIIDALHTSLDVCRGL